VILNIVSQFKKCEGQSEN